MHDPPRILIVDDNETNRDILATRLGTQGYDIYQAADGEEAVAFAKDLSPDVVLLDVMMPKMGGIEVCQHLRSEGSHTFMSIIIVTAKVGTNDIVAGLDAGADEYLTKPVDQASLVARVRSVLRLKALHDQVLAQAADLSRLNLTLERRVSEQVAEIERFGRLTQFLPPQVARMVSSGNEHLLESHRREVTVVFCDLRSFTTFSEIAEPEEVMLVLREYHTALGVLISKFEGTVERFTGDGLLVLFNDPMPCADQSMRAVNMALEMRHEVGNLSAKWNRAGHDIGFGIGIARGYATLGAIGYEGRFQYSVTGTVANLASRLCNAANDGQILVDLNVLNAVEPQVEIEFENELTLPGFRRLVKAFNLRGLRT